MVRIRQSRPAPHAIWRQRARRTKAGAPWQSLIPGHQRVAPLLPSQQFSRQPGVIPSLTKGTPVAVAQFNQPNHDSNETFEV